MPKLTEEDLKKQEQELFNQLKAIEDNPGSVNDDVNDDDKEEDILVDDNEIIPEEPADDDDSYQEEQPPRKKKGAKERIQELLSRVSDLESKLSEKNLEDTKNKAKVKADEIFKSDSELKAEFLKAVGSNNTEEIFKSLEKLSEHKAKKLLKEQLTEIAPILDDLVIEKTAKTHSVDSSAIRKVFSEYPELRDMGEKGIELAKKLIGKSNKNSPAQAASVGNSAARSTTNKAKAPDKVLDPKKLSKKDIQTIFEKLKIM